MPKPLSICIEHLDAKDEDQRYVRCVALAGNEPGLGLDSDGGILWKTGKPACELWISQDERLILLKPEGCQALITVRRTGRSLEVPAGKPVVLLDQDEVQVAEHQFRIHVHGEAAAEHAPTPLRNLIRTAAGVAAAVAITASGAMADEPIQVRPTPPKPVATDRLVKPPMPPADAGVPGPDASVQPPIEVRVKPPAPMPGPAPTPKPKPNPQPKKSDSK